MPAAIGSLVYFLITSDSQKVPCEKERSDPLAEIPIITSKSVILSTDPHDFNHQCTG
jgi:hypothetical protein